MFLSIFFLIQLVSYNPLSLISNISEVLSPRLFSDLQNPRESFSELRTGAFFVPVSPFLPISLKSLSLLSHVQM